VVNVFNTDLIDFLPGDDNCDTDAITPGPQCTLRAAVMEANAKPGPDNIQFLDNTDDGNTITLTLGGAGDASQGDLDITEQVSIDGIAAFGRPRTSLLTATPNRFFDINVPAGQVVSLSELRLTGGDLSSDSGGAVRARGNGMLVIDTVEFRNNEAPGGGALDTTIDTVVRNSHFEANISFFSSAAIHSMNADLLVERSSFLDHLVAGKTNQTIGSFGDGSLSVIASTLSDNNTGVRGTSNSILIERTTIVSNNGNAVDLGPNSTVVLRGNILTNSSGDDCSFTAPGNLSSTYNLIQDGQGSCTLGPGNVSGSPGLAPAARDDGQLTYRHAPEPGSQVIDAVPLSAESCSPGQLDQWGQTGAIDSDGDGEVACELGSWEIQTVSGDEIFSDHFEDL